MGISSIIGAGISNIGNRMSEERQAKWNIEQWERQSNYDREQWDATNRYNEHRWNLENEYNSPQMQMARFKEAGLNPNLIYGQGNPGNAGSLTADNLKSPDVKGYSRSESKNIMQGFNAFQEYQRFQQTGAQIDNIKADTNVKNQNAQNLKDANVIQIAKEAREQGIFDNETIKLWESTIDKALKDLQIKEGILKAQGQTWEIGEKKKAGMDQESILKKQQEKLNAFEIGLNETGTTSKDSLLFRQILEAFGTPAEIIEKMEKEWKAQMERKKHREIKLRKDDIPYIDQYKSNKY